MDAVGLAKGWWLTVVEWAVVDNGDVWFSVCLLYEGSRVKVDV